MTDIDNKKIPEEIPEPQVTEADVATALAEAEQTLPNKPASSDITTPSKEDINTPSEEDVLADTLAAKRNEHVQQFKINFSLDDIPDVESENTRNETDDVEPLEPSPTDPVGDEDDEDTSTEFKKSSGCLPKLIVCLLIFFLSCSLAVLASSFVLEVMGNPGSSSSVDVVIPKGANTQQIAEILKDNSVIDNTYYFRIYSRLTKADGKWQVGAFTLYEDMSYTDIVETLQVATPRETVTVMLREGLTVDEMAVILEEKGVCSAKSFREAVLYGEYDYDFVRAIPTTEDNPDIAYRVYRLEGYLFPDTYEFYANSLGETVVNTMLANFESKLTNTLLEQIEAKGWTLDQAITFASMVQGEGDTQENMDKVSRVLHNRLAPNSGFKLLQLCCTRDYANEMAENDHFSAEVLHRVYNTYQREGFPIGPIGNPGLEAIKATFAPSEDATIMKCYYFATDYKTGITYFSKNFKEHQAIIKKYGIEDLG